MPPTCLFNFAAAEISRPPIALQPSDHSKKNPDIQTDKFWGPWHQITGLIMASFTGIDAVTAFKVPSKCTWKKKTLFRWSSSKSQNSRFHQIANVFGLKTTARRKSESQPHLKTSPIPVWLSLSRRSIRERWRAGLPWEPWLCPWKNVSVGLCADHMNCEDPRERYTSAQMKGEVQRRRERGGRRQRFPRWLTVWFGH